MLEKGLKPITVRKKKGGSPVVQAWRNHPGGYPMLAERIALKPQMGIYRRFDALNARHILYLQAELCILEKELRNKEREDRKKIEGGSSKYAADYQRMLETPGDEDKCQLQLIKKMHKKLNQYSRCRHEERPRGEEGQADPRMLQTKPLFSFQPCIKSKDPTNLISTTSSTFCTAKTWSLTI
jgi:hypothetical protein